MSPPTIEGTVWCPITWSAGLVGRIVAREAGADAAGAAKPVAPQVEPSNWDLLGEEL